MRSSTSSDVGSVEYPVAGTMASEVAPSYMLNDGEAEAVAAPGADEPAPKPEL